MPVQDNEALTPLPAAPTERLSKGTDALKKHTIHFYERRWAAFKVYLDEHEISETVGLDRALRVLLADAEAGGNLLASINQK